MDNNDLTQLAARVAVLVEEVRRHRDTLYGTNGRNGLVSSVAVLRRFLEFSVAIVIAVLSAIIGKVVL